MANTDTGAALTTRHRQQQRTLRALTLRDLIRLWRGVDPTNLSGTIGPFTEAAVLLIRQRFGDSAGLASSYFQEFRQAEGATGTAAIVRPDPPPREVVAGAVRGAGLSGIMNARRAGFPVQAAADNGLVKVSGTTASLVLAGGRKLITEAALGDRRARGWQRLTRGETCDFCRGLSGRVFASQADFETHDHCDCTAEPVY